MFSYREYILELNNPENRFIVNIIHFKPTNKYICDISLIKDKVIKVQIILGKYSYISYKTNDSLLMFEVLATFLQRLGVNIPYNFNHVPTHIIEKKYVNLGNIILFKSAYHKFKINIQERHYGYFIKIGGKTFDSCIEIFIKNNNPSSIAQIYSEQECGYDSFLLNGQVVDMIKSSLQLCQALFDIDEFQLKDESHIECGKKNYSKAPPRKPRKPLSLAFLYLVKYCKTWYEYNFNAFIKNNTHRKEYHDALAKLNSKIEISYEEFAELTNLTDEQYEELYKYFNSENTWMDFFRKIPKDKHCDNLTWISDFIPRLIGFNPTHYDWVIFLEPPINKIDNSSSLIVSPEIKCGKNNFDEKTPMIRTDMIILTDLVQKGGKKSRYTRSNKYKRNYVRFNNQNNIQLII